MQGVWLPRTQKHRYAFILDKNMKVLLDECERPRDRSENSYSCCHGTNEVYDKRFNKRYTCPKCTSSIKELPQISDI